jgi:hypothetical protein
MEVEGIREDRYLTLERIGDMRGIHLIPPCIISTLGTNRRLPNMAEMLNDDPNSCAQDKGQLLSERYGSYIPVRVSIGD